MKTGARKRPRGSKVSHKRTTRVAIDFPIKEHRRLKALAALEGLSLQEYIRRRVDAGAQAGLISDEEFGPLMEKIIEENDEILRRLADK